MSKFCFIYTLLALSVAWAAPRTKPETSTLLSEGDGPQFRCQLGQELGTERDSLHLVVAISVPYDNLVFLRTDSGFASSFELVTSVFRDTLGLFTERISDVIAAARTFTETNSRSRSASHVEKLLVPPGTYRVRVTLTADREAHRKSKWDGSITLAPSDARLRVSDIFWMSTTRGSNDTNVPSLVESFSSTDSIVRARVQVYSVDKDTIRLRWSVLGQKGDTIRTGTSEVTPADTIQTAEYPLEIKGLIPQQYSLKVEAVGNGRREVRSRNFSIHIPGIPVSITDLDQAIRQLKYVASSSEMSKLRQANPAEREQLFKNFWKNEAEANRGNAEEMMAEYYQRVEYSNDHFSTNRAGWESDRGRIYITYGEPTDIERHPFELNSPPYEVWFYAQNAKRFVFVDYSGFGDYTLVTPEFGY